MSVGKRFCLVISFCRICLDNSDDATDILCHVFLLLLDNVNPFLRIHAALSPGYFLLSMVITLDTEPAFSS